MSQEQNSFDLEKLWFYFDALAQDRLDNSALTRKSSEVLALRQKLLLLPEQQFEAAMKTISKLVEDVNVDRRKQTTEEERKRRNAVELFNRTTDMANDKISKADRVSRV